MDAQPGTSEERSIEGARTRRGGTAAATPATHAGSLVAVIPAHDEASRIEDVVTGTLRHLPVVVIDDGSTDETSARAQAAGASVIRQVPNQGKGAALRTAFAWAIDAGLDGVVTLDGDGQHDPAELRRFLDAHAVHPEIELVIGRRDFARMPPIRRLANLLGTIVLSAALGRWVPDNQSGYRLVGRRLMGAMRHSRENGFEFEVEMIAICLREGWPVRWIPIRTIYGDERSHIRAGRHLREFLRMALTARRIARSRKP